MIIFHCQVQLKLQLKLSWAEFSLSCGEPTKHTKHTAYTRNGIVVYTFSLLMAWTILKSLNMCTTCHNLFKTFSNISLTSSWLIHNFFTIFFDLLITFQPIFHDFFLWGVHELLWLAQYLFMICAQLTICSWFVHYCFKTFHNSLTTCLWLLQN